jgi:hypothetical protein
MAFSLCSYFSRYEGHLEVYSGLCVQQQYCVISCTHKQFWGRFLFGRIGKSQNHNVVCPLGFVVLLLAVSGL